MDKELLMGARGVNTTDGRQLYETLLRAGD